MNMFGPIIYISFDKGMALSTPVLPPTVPLTHGANSGQPA